MVTREEAVKLLEEAIEDEKQGRSFYADLAASIQDLVGHENAIEIFRMGMTENEHAATLEKILAGLKGQ